MIYFISSLYIFQTTDELGLAVSPCCSVLYRYVMLMWAQHNWALSLSHARGSWKWLLKLAFKLSCSYLLLESEVMKGKEYHPFETESCSFTHCLKTCGYQKGRVLEVLLFFFFKFKILTLKKLVSPLYINEAAVSVWLFPLTIHFTNSFYNSVKNLGRWWWSFIFCNQDASYVYFSLQQNLIYSK